MKTLLNLEELHIFADIDGDLDPDLIFSGRIENESGNGEALTTIFINGNNQFAQIAENPFNEITWSHIDVADIDGDLDIDILLTNADSSTLFLNDGVGTFSIAEGLPFRGAQPGYRGDIHFSDLNGDSAPDLIISGASKNFGVQTYAYINNTQIDSDGDGITNFEDDCPLDANAFLDSCGDCVGGETELEPCCAEPFPSVDESSL